MTEPEQPSAIQAVTHVLPLLAVVVALIAAIVILSMFDKPVDRVLYDALIGTSGAIAGVSWVRH